MFGEYFEYYTIILGRFCAHAVYYKFILLLLLSDRIARTTYVDAVYCYRPSRVVCRYFSLLKILGLETLERRRLINDLVLYYKILNGHCDIVLNVALGYSVTRGILNLPKNVQQ